MKKLVALLMALVLALSCTRPSPRKPLLLPVQ